MSIQYKAPTVQKALSPPGKSIADSAAAMKISDPDQVDAEIEQKLRLHVRTGLPRSKSWGPFLRNPHTKRYTPGLTLFELGRAAYEPHRYLSDLARP